MDYKRKIDFAIRLLRAIPQDGPIELSYSTGKDSDVILELAKMAGIPFKPIYKNTTCDRPGSIKHAKEMGVEIRQPKMNMLQLIKKNGWPSRWARFCCKFLKEYKIYDRAIIGIRKAESVARAKRYKEPEQCRVYNNKEKVRQYLPILEWTNEDVQRFVEERQLKLHPHYYDEEGRFHVERRVGCIGCPLQTDCGRRDFSEYPTMFRARAKSYAKWFKEHPNAKTPKTFGDVYHALYMKLFCASMEEYYLKTSNQLFVEHRVEDPKSFLENYFKVDLSDIDKL